MEKDKITRDDKAGDPDKGVSDTGQGSAGDLGSEGDFSTDKVSGNDDKSKKVKKKGNLVTIVRQDKNED